MHNLTSNKLSILTQMWSMDKTKTIIFANWIQINLFHLFPMQEPPCKKKRVKKPFWSENIKDTRVCLSIKALTVDTKTISIIQEYNHQIPLYHTLWW